MPHSLLLALLLALVLPACDQDGDGSPDARDCVATNPLIFPGAWEECDGLDNDCDGAVDELYDLDGDGALADDAGCRALGDPVDCDDLDAAIHPGAEELPDGADNDCDGTPDDSPDSDGDGFGAFEDCDDADPFTSPAAPEACDGLDNDCDGAVDEDWDEDSDGFSPCMGDCNDADPRTSPATAETCNGLDDDCDGHIDEDADADGDTWTWCAGDCDDADPTSWPGAFEACDGLDNDCDPDTIEDLDDDADGWRLCDGDCDDADPAVHPGAEEACDGLDNDCTGTADDGSTDCACASWGLLASYPLDGDAVDVAGGGLDGTPYAVTATSDRFDRRNAALSFDGASTWVDLPLDANRIPLSFSAWFRADRVRGEQSIVDSDEGGHWGHSLINGYSDADGDLDVQYHDGYLDSGISPEEGRWYHVVVSFDARIRLFLDSALVLEEPYPLGIVDGSTFRLGRHNEGDPQWFMGAIDDVRFYACALTDDEVAALYADPGE